MNKFLLVFITGLSLASCAQSENKDVVADTTEQTAVDLDTLQTAYFASGCFWCVEAIYESVEGVHEVESGYSGGLLKNPTYEQVSSGRTKHAEAVKIYYDSSVVSYETLVDVFFNSHDPTTRNAQGPDHGPQYRSIAFYQNTSEKEIINKKIRELLKSKTFSTITTQVTEFDTFYKAEDYHQDYEKRHPNHPYIQRISVPRIKKFQKKMPEVLKSEH